MQKRLKWEKKDPWKDPKSYEIRAGARWEGRKRHPRPSWKEGLGRKKVTKSPGRGTRSIEKKT